MTDEIAKRLKVFERVLAEVPEIVYAGDPVLRRQTAKRAVPSSPLNSAGTWTRLKSAKATLSICL